MVRSGQLQLVIREFDHQSKEKGTSTLTLDWENIENMVQQAIMFLENRLCHKEG